MEILIVEEAADKQGIYVRSGGLCNFGGIATYLKFTERELRAAYARGHRCNKPMILVEGRATGVVRISMDAMSIREDIDKFISFAQETYIGNCLRSSLETFEKHPAVVATSDAINEKAMQYLARRNHQGPVQSRRGRSWFRKTVHFCADR